MTDGTTSVARAQVDMVLVPATTGDFGILPGHVPTVSQLRPGVVSVHLNDKDVKKYFVSSGFAFVHADSTADICAIEAVPVEQLDGDAVRKGLAEHQAKFTNANDDFEKANAQIGIDVCNAMVQSSSQFGETKKQRFTNRFHCNILQERLPTTAAFFS